MQLKGIQQSAADLFRTYASLIPDDRAEHQESAETDPHIDVGASQLMLKVIPRSAEYCGLTLWVNEQFYEGQVGRYGSLLRFPTAPHGQQSGILIQEIDRLLRCVVYGIVEEVEHFWLNRMIGGETWLSDAEGRYRVGFRGGILFGLSLVLPGVRERRNRYQAYAPQRS